MFYFSMPVYTAIAGVLLLSLTFIHRSWKSRSIARKHAPPEAGGAWPIIGHLHLLGGGTQLLHKILGSLADKYGSIFTIRLGVHGTLVVSSPEVAKEIFTEHDLFVSSRPQVLALKYLGFNYSMFGFAPPGSFWRELRKITTHELLSNRRLDLLKHVRISETDTSIKELYNKWADDQKENGLSRTVLVDMKKWFGDLTLNLMLRMIAGKRYCGENLSDENEARHFRKVLRDFSILMGQNVVADTLPFLRWFDIGGHEKAMKIVGKEMSSLLKGWLEEHRLEKATHKDDDFMHVLISLLEGEDLGHDTDSIVKATCMALISGGTDTTTITMIWALSLLLNNRNVLRKAQEELDIHVGRDRKINEADIGKLPYLQAIVKETFRIYPPGPLTTTREFTESRVVSGYQVPKGTRLILNLWKLQMDPHAWPDPLEFKPERFFTTHKDVDIKGHHFELLPFGCGRRICPAVNFGHQIICFVLANFLHSYEISTPFNESVDMSESVAMTNMKATPFDILVAPRLPSKLY